MSQAGRAGASTGPFLSWSNHSLKEVALELGLVPVPFALVFVGLFVGLLGFVKAERSCQSS